MALKWGIAGCGKISHDFVNALSILPESDHEVVAVGARSLQKAEEFARLHNIPNAYQGYQRIAQNREVEVVYIGTLNPQHLEVAKLMLENQKAVLCEKPLTLNFKQTRKLVELAREKKLFLMEAMWSRAFPAYKEMIRQIESGTIGEVQHVTVTLGAPLSSIERLNAKDLGGGTILDLGVYTLQFQQLAFKGLEPEKIIATGHLNEGEVDDSVSIILKYPEGKSALIQTSSRVLLPNEGIIVGTKGIIRMPTFWCPTKLILQDEIKEYPLPEAKLPFNFYNSAGLCFEAEEVRQCLKQGLTENPTMSLEESLQLADLMTRIRRQIGVFYREDKDYSQTD